MATFGKEIMQKEFMHDPQLTFLNHGSYGAVPSKVLEFRIDMIRNVERQPDEHFRWKAESLWADNVQCASDFFGSKPENLVFVANTTTGINAVVRSLPLKKGDAILNYAWTYGAIKNMTEWVAEQKELEVLYVDHPTPLLSVQDLLDAYELMLTTHDNIKLVVLDYISSVPPVLLPLQQLVALCRRYNKMILVDGAHTPGQLQLNLEELGVDFFVGNMHKWAFTPRGCAVLWVNPSYHRQVFPTVISVVDRSVMSNNFSYQGTADNSTYYTAARAIQFYKDIGGYEVISAYCSDLVQRGADLLVQRWNTKHFPIPDSMKAPFMRLVRIPDLSLYPAHIIERRDFIRRITDITTLTKVVWDRFRIQAIFVSLDNEPWCRISASVYNELEDYEKLASAILELVNEQ